MKFLCFSVRLFPCLISKWRLLRSERVENFPFFSSSWGIQRKREGGSAHFYAVGLLNYTKTFSSSPPMYEIIIIFKWMKKYRHGDWWSMPNCVGPIYRTRCGQGSSMYLNRSKNETKNVWKCGGSWTWTTTKGQIICVQCCRRWQHCVFI